MEREFPQIRSPKPSTNLVQDKRTEEFGCSRGGSAPEDKHGGGMCYLRHDQVEHHGHHGETHLQLLPLDRGWVLPAGHICQGVENVT